MWWEEQSAVRFNIFASISQAFSFQLIKSFQSRRFTIVLYYEAAEHAANVIKRFNTKEFTAKFFSELVIKISKKPHLFD